MQDLPYPLQKSICGNLGCGNLYRPEFTLETDGGTDILSSYAGLREVRIDGFKVLINGKSVFQRTVLDQGFTPTEFTPRQTMRL